MKVTKDFLRKLIKESLDAQPQVAEAAGPKFIWLVGVLAIKRDSHEQDLIYGVFENYSPALKALEELNSAHAPPDPHRDDYYDLWKLPVTNKINIVKNGVGKMVPSPLDV